MADAAGKEAMTARQSTALKKSLPEDVITFTFLIVWHRNTGTNINLCAADFIGARGLASRGFPDLNFIELDYAAFGAEASSMLVMCRMAHSMYFCAYESGFDTPTPTSMVFFLTNAKS